MALGDGTSWDETAPTDASNAVDIDDYNRDLRIGTRLRMANEHEWASSDSTTSASGMHKFITFQQQTTKAALAGTQISAIYVKSNGLYFENSAGTEILLAKTGAGDPTASFACSTLSATNLAVGGSATFVGLLKVSGTGNSLIGAVGSTAMGVVVKATSDVFVIAHGTGGGSGNPTIKLIADTTTTAPTTIIAAEESEGNSAKLSISWWVANGEYFKGTQSDCGAGSGIRWRSIGA